MGVDVVILLLERAAGEGDGAVGQLGEDFERSWGICGQADSGEESGGGCGLEEVAAGEVTGHRGTGEFCRDYTHGRIEMYVAGFGVVAGFRFPEFSGRRLGCARQGIRSSIPGAHRVGR